MSRAGDVLARAGLLPEGVVAQARQWGTPLPDPDEAAPGPGYVSEALEEALQAPGVRELVTDPQLRDQFLATQRDAFLVLVRDGEQMGARIAAGRHVDGSWLVPWQGADVSDLLTNGESHLACGGRRYFFSEVREFYYGETKAFLRCFVSTEESDDGA